MALRNKKKFLDDPPAGFDGVFEWDYLIPAFKKATGRNIKPMDIDAHVEIKGHHLIFETKAEGVPVPLPQLQAMRQLWAKGYHTVILLWGKDFPIECEIWWPGGREEKIRKYRLTRDSLLEVCERWARWAEERPCPFQYDERLRHL